MDLMGKPVDDLTKVLNAYNRQKTKWEEHNAKTSKKESKQQ
jgi:hypothetical protein